jgi:hypothetical protein
MGEAESCFRFPIPPFPFRPFSLSFCLPAHNFPRERRRRHRVRTRQIHLSRPRAPRKIAVDRTDGHGCVV